jgi:GTP-binding protein HflX
VRLKDDSSSWKVEDSLEELEQLSSTAQLQVVGQTYQNLKRIDPATYIGKGKLEEIQTWLAALEFDLLVFDDELSPRQQRNIENTLGVRVLDRTSLILDIFAQHARTREGAMQVELAQYEYLLPRLTHQWAHLNRQVAAGGGRRGRSARGAGSGPGSLGAGLRGPGETQLETDQREISDKIAQLRDKLENVRTQRGLHRQQRRKSGIPTVALVGYTNAGKSTLLNALSGSDVFTANQLFATLDPTTRRVALPSGRQVLVTDTVGFINKLPTNLVAAFRATLEEIAEADVLVHVVDITHRAAVEQSAAAVSILQELGAGEKPLVIALNKIDKLPQAELSPDVVGAFEGGLPISAAQGTGLENLLLRIEGILQRMMVSVKVRLPYNQAELAALFHDQGSVEWEEYSEQGATIKGFLPERLRDTFRSYLVGDIKSG